MLNLAMVPQRQEQCEQLVMKALGGGEYNHNLHIFLRREFTAVYRTAANDVFDVHPDFVKYGGQSEHWLLVRYLLEGDKPVPRGVGGVRPRLRNGKPRPKVSARLRKKRMLALGRDPGHGA